MFFIAKKSKNYINKDRNIFKEMKLTLMTNKKGKT